MTSSPSIHFVDGPLDGLLLAEVPPDWRSVHLIQFQDRPGSFYLQMPPGNDENAPVEFRHTFDPGVFDEGQVLFISNVPPRLQTGGSI